MIEIAKYRLLQLTSGLYKFQINLNIPPTQIALLSNFMFLLIASTYLDSQHHHFSFKYVRYIYIMISVMKNILQDNGIQRQGWEVGRTGAGT